MAEKVPAGVRIGAREKSLRSRLGSALGFRPPRRKSTPRTDDDRAITWLWPYLALTVKRRYPPRYESRDALILQMGRVASVSIQQALQTRGYNAYHSHALSAGRRLGLLHRLDCAADDPARHGALAGHVATLAHHELVRWYQRHKRRNGERLRIVTLTRDPVTWMSSHLVLQQQQALPQIRRWHAATAGAAASAEGHAAVQAFGAALGEMILATRPSQGVEQALAAMRRRAAERWPGDRDFADLAQHLLACATWFDTEIKALLGIDLLAQPGLRERGVTHGETDYAAIIALRFEDLDANAQALADFLGLADFTLPHVNRGAGMEDGPAIRDAFEAGIEQAGGPAVRRELRATPYAKACGYDRLTG